MIIFFKRTGFPKLTSNDFHLISNMSHTIQLSKNIPHQLVLILNALVKNLQNRFDIAPTVLEEWLKIVLNLDDTVAINHELQRSDIDPYLLNVLEKNSSTRLIMAGHRHSSIIHDVRFSDDYSLTHVMTGAFAIDSRNWRLIQLTSERIIISHPGTARTQYTISLY